jgi:UDP-glucose 4-epimerase
MNILVTGGAGYIGSHFVNQLRKTEHKILVVDNFRESRNNIINDSKIEYLEMDLRDKNQLATVFEKPIDIVAHFAALASVPDSVVCPSEYYDVNVKGGLNLLDCMIKAKVKKIIFSSSASVYGEPQMEAISEDHPKVPTNPYGRTKLIFEQILGDYYNAYGLNSISFRYFCAAGVDVESGLGEYHNPETHVIPSIIETLIGKRSEFKIFGNDYPTPDGTGIRDFIHVNDVASAHLMVMEKLVSSNSVYDQYNLGNSRGYSVLELIEASERLSGLKLNYSVFQRRPGDPSSLIADNSKARQELDWQPKCSDLDNLIGSALTFFKQKS